ncbi:WAT1-related protein At5g40230-like isoform X1 [Rhododendron vialii]|uniref:WAT1-related protein At5g40230-like isoform X1 n=1 Tax=Rhododendron vialii TaxID=182163 RepID=UPI0026603805|nr:WAT1-related protein At5g40230-like isoform X1 [Rhododendron vialii]
MTMKTKVKGEYLEREVVPFLVMVIVEITNVGTNIIFKSATKKGLSYLVFMFYSYAVSSLFFMPMAFLFHRKTDLPPFSLNIFGRIFGLALLGFTSQMLGYKGIDISDPTLGSAISNLTPAFTFALAILFRMENISIRSASTQAKMIGTIVSISGALIVVLYAGPPLITPSSPSLLPNQTTIGSPQSGWVLGGFLLAVDYSLVAVWYIFQAQTARKYPAEFVLVFVYNVCLTLISAPVCLFLEPNSHKWELRADISLVAVLYAGVIGASGIVVHIWGLRVKGPVYVASFRPLSIAIAAVMGVIYLGDSLYLGCVIGAIAISVGFYVVMWGKVKEDMIEDSGACSLESPRPESVPLLK